MSRRKKIEKLIEIHSLPNVFHPEDSIRGEWHSAYFKNTNPITLELGCGTGAYTLGLATMHPEKNYIGVDIKGARIWYGATAAIEQKLNRVAFLRAPIEQLDQYLADGEVGEIWITFPDPFFSPNKPRRRLTAPRFLELYKKILKPGGIVHFKTDDEPLFDFTLETLDELGISPQVVMRDIYKNGPPSDPLLQIQTAFEKKHLANEKKIFYLRFCF